MRDETAARRDKALRRLQGAASALIDAEEHALASEGYEEAPGRARAFRAQG